MSAITGAAGFVWGLLVLAVKETLLRSDQTLPEQGGFACGWLICSPLAAFAGTLGFGYGLFAQSTTKTFDMNSTDEDIEAFCLSPAAMAFTCISIKQNGNVTNRTLVAIGRCFWLTKISITSCENMDGES